MNVAPTQFQKKMSSEHAPGRVLAVWWSSAKHSNALQQVSDFNGISGRSGTGRQCGMQLFVLA